MYLVTGGAGFIGSHIVEELVRRGAPVRVLDDLSNGLASNLDAFGSAVELVEGDIRDFDATRCAMEGASYVLHLAALGSVARSIDDPVTSNAVNVEGTLNVLVAAREARVRRVVFSSSSSVYGDSPALPKREEQPTIPISPYAASKLAAENYARVFARVYDLETVALRYFNVFGPRQRPDSQYAAVIPLFMRAAVEGTTLTIFGDGEQSRDFTYVTNVVSANLLACEAAGVSGRVFNVACGARHSVLDIIASLERTVGHPLPREHRPPRTGDIKHTAADISAAREALGFDVLVGFDEGMAQTWKAFVEQYARRGKPLA